MKEFVRLRARWLGFACLLHVLLPAGVAAHDADTSLTRIRLGDSRMEVEITLDLLTAARLAPLVGSSSALDRTAPSQITRSAFDGQAAGIRRWLEDHVRIAIDGNEVGLGDASGLAWEADSDLRDSSTWAQDLVVFQWQRDVDGLPEEIALLYEVWPEIGFSHRNLTVLEEAWQDPVEIPFSPDAAEYVYFPREPPPVLDQVARFVVLGIEHIFIGFDHILFLAGLVVIARRRSLLGLVTAFTIGHSITLGLATTGLVELPGRWVEVAIAATIVWVAVENLLQAKPRHRARLAFFFGLVHGFGFAEVLGELALPFGGLLRALFSFNLGVEAGQIAILIVLWPISAWLARTTRARLWQQLVSVLIGLAGMGWLIDRLAGTNYMPI